MNRKEIIKELRKRQRGAKERSINGKYDHTRDRNKGRIHAYELAINLLMTNERQNNEQR